MSGKFSKRGKNPRAVDTWLESLGLYRKNVAYDETCMFRAVAEQLFCSQMYHERVRNECIAYGKKYSKEFKEMVPKKRDWYDRLKKLSLHLLVCTDIELYLVCKTFRVDITIYNATNRNVQIFRYSSLYGGKMNILLCQMGDDHYDAVYDKGYIVDAGFCQSIVYQLLYEKVFNIPDVTSIVNIMLHDKQPSNDHGLMELLKIEASDNDSDTEGDNSGLDGVLLHPGLVAPFPFKVAKALDPDMYRNIEYDSWLEIRRVLRLGDWYYGDNNLILGTRCNLDISDKSYSCYIQSICKEEDKCLVYVIELAQRWTVKYSELKPENNAKPWPLPYRFVRNQPANQDSTDSTSPDNERRSLRKRREKKRFNSTSEAGSQMALKDANGNITDLNVNNYEGVSLFMQETSETDFPERPNIKLHIPQNQSGSLGVAADWPQAPNEVPSEATIPFWYPESANSQDGAACVDFADNSINQPPSSSVFGDINGNESSISYTCNEYTFPTMPEWPQPPYAMAQDSSGCDSSPRLNYSKNYVYYPAASYPSPPFISTPPAFAPYPVPVNERFVCSTPVNSVSPQVEMYPFLYPFPPAPPTPVVYSNIPPPTPPPSAVAHPVEVRSPVPVYTPTHEVCVNSPTYVYPPNPPVTWYSPVQSQGFIFPPPPTPPIVPNLM